VKQAQLMSEEARALLQYVDDPLLDLIIWLLYGTGMRLLGPHLVPSHLTRHSRSGGNPEVWNRNLQLQV